MMMNKERHKTRTTPKTRHWKNNTCGATHQMRRRRLNIPGNKRATHTMFHTQSFPPNWRYSRALTKPPTPAHRVYNTMLAVMKEPRLPFENMPMTESDNSSNVATNSWDPAPMKAANKLVCALDERSDGNCQGAWVAAHNGTRTSCDTQSHTHTHTHTQAAVHGWAGGIRRHGSTSSRLPLHQTSVLRPFEPCT